MAFSETIKSEVKQKAAFRCCRCHEIGIEVHHIIERSRGGNDDIENAAPLCPNCHTNFGANPEKTKEVRQMRDWWYEVVSEKYSEGSEKWEKINNILVEMQKGSDKRMDEFKEELKKIQDNVKDIKKINASKAIQHNTNELITATTLGDNVHANFNCKKCGTSIGLLIGTDYCPNCKTPINNN